MNCYYSNLIEGHDTHPIDIERALRDDLSSDPRRRDLQLEAKAHISVQRWIDGGGLRGRAATVDGICDIHRRFALLLPEDLLYVEDPDTHERATLVPGALRDRGVKVGNHVAVSPGAVPRFLRHFEHAYSRLGRSEAVLAAAAAHHRLVWIHPFLDGNGRVARLMSHAILLEALDTGGIWSIARGLARDASTYKALLASCDLPRRNDLNGRGNLSEEELVRFTRFFLETCLDQVAFMEGLIRPDGLRSRVLSWVQEEAREGRLSPRSGAILEAVLYRGEVPRGDVAGLLGVTPRHARRMVAALVERGALVADASHAPLRLGLSAALAPRWLPGLFPELPG